MAVGKALEQQQAMARINDGRSRTKWAATRKLNFILEIGLRYEVSLQEQSASLHTHFDGTMCCRQ
jgi:hypothetical protein